MKRHLTAVILNLDQAALTIDVLEKLASLSVENWLIQLVLVDNGSQAGQLRMLQNWVSENQNQFEDVLFVAASRNLGATGGRNLALNAASKDRILILDNDVVLPGNSAWLEKLWQVMEGDSKAAIVAPMLVFADRPETVQATGIGLTKQGRVGYINRYRTAERISPELVEVVATPTACWLMRKEAQQSVGLLSDMYYPIQFEDVDFCIRLKLAGWKIVVDPSVHIKHIENVTTKNLKQYPFARLTVSNGMAFKEKWAEVLPGLATITQDEISWEPAVGSKSATGGILPQ